MGVHVAADIKEIVEARLKEHIPATDLPDQNLLAKKPNVGF